MLCKRTEKETHVDEISKTPIRVNKLRKTEIETKKMRQNYKEFTFWKTAHVDNFERHNQRKKYKKEEEKIKFKKIRGIKILRWRSHVNKPHVELGEQENKITFQLHNNR